MREHFKQYLWVNIGVILGSFALLGGIFFLMSQALGGKTSEITANRTAILKRSADLETVSRLKLDMAAAAEVQKKIDALLPSQDSLISFPQFMTALARTRSLTLSFNFEGAPVPGSASNPGYVNFNAGIDGSAGDIRAFVTELESGTTKFMVNLTSVTLQPRGGTYHAELKGQTFFQENKTNPS